MAAAGKAVKTKLFIGNLDPATQTAELNELFASYGNVLEASVIKDYGFVHYGTIEEAEKAVSGLNNKEFHGKRLRVELSTSTVRHRPGQPEPASALRHPRARQGVGGPTPPLGLAGGNHSSRYANPVPPAAGAVGPMRHSAAWTRHDARPYAPIGREPTGMPAEYGLTPPPYDRSRPYDVRPDHRNYYGDGPDAPYPSVYDMPPYGSNRNGDEADAYGSRAYRDGHLRPPPPPPPEPMGYGPQRGYERHGDVPPGDPYYDNGPAPHDADPYRNNYEMYSKYYQGRGRPESDYPGPPPPSRDYDPYPNYRPDSYAPSNGQAPYRHHSNVASPSQHHGGYPPNPRQQPPLYPSGGSTAGGAAPHSHYYGAHHRA